MKMKAMPLVAFDEIAPPSFDHIATLREDAAPNETLAGIDDLSALDDIFQTDDHVLDDIFAPIDEAMRFKRAGRR
jgi:hypothetical protein